MRKLIIFFATLSIFGLTPFLTSAATVSLSSSNCDALNHNLSFTAKIHTSGDKVNTYSIHANWHNITDEASCYMTNIEGWWQFQLDCVWSDPSIQPGNNYTIKIEVWTDSGDYAQDERFESCSGCPDRDSFSAFDSFLTGATWAEWKGEIKKCVDNRVIVARSDKGITGLRVWMDRGGANSDRHWIAPIFNTVDFDGREVISGKGEGYHCYDLCPGSSDNTIEFECPNGQFLKGFKFVRVRDGDGDKDGFAFSYKCGTLESSGGNWQCKPYFKRGDVRDGDSPDMARHGLAGYCISHWDALGGGAPKWSDSGTFEIGANKIFTGVAWLYDYKGGNDSDYFSFNFRYKEVVPLIALLSISGKVKDNNDNPMAGVTVEIEHWHNGHQEFHYKDTDSDGKWRQEVYKGDNFAVRISSGIPSGSTIKAINNRSCHSDASTYEWQVADERKFKGCGYDDERSWDLDSDEDYDFVVTLPAETCSYKKCVGSECVEVTQSPPCPADECSSDSDCGGSDGSTCDCTPWVNRGCGGNGCEPTEMWRTRHCCCSGGCFDENDCERHGDCLNFHARGLIWTANGDPIAFIDRNGNMFLDEFWYDHRTGGWFGDEKFKIKCGSSIVARMDSRGNLYLKGALITKGSPKDKGFVVKSNGVVVAQIDCSGNLILKGKVYKNINAVW